MHLEVCRLRGLEKTMLQLEHSSCTAPRAYFIILMVLHTSTMGRTHLSQLENGGDMEAVALNYINQLTGVFV